MTYFVLFAVVVALVVGSWAGWRLVSQRRSLPCPTSLSWLLDNPFTAGYHSAVLSRLELSPGLTILDAGCGPGLLTIPTARAVGAQGSVLALDLQPGMIKMVQEKAAEAGLSNIRFLVAGLGEGRLPESSFDRALLVTVLGEVPDRLAALLEIHKSLKPGGFLSITEVLPDPHYQSSRKTEALALRAGFQLRNKYGNWFAFTLNVERPRAA
ncbi:MAG: hypothetical protein A2Z37_02185 [Chloroflexi bacterium RBG_19FT_COMBO_62_14]|nr:MAG: hypothetical protein A2Z37_02185 [Chloroflexi bacterium RBG_19FT_COMBO_62_14]